MSAIFTDTFVTAGGHSLAPYSERPPLTMECVVVGAWAGIIGSWHPTSDRTQRVLDARSIGTAALAVIKSRRAGHLCFVTGQFLPSQTRAPRQLPLRTSDLRCG